MSDWETHEIALSHGRIIETLTYGSGTSGTLVFHSGTPGGLARRDFFAEVCDQHGLRFVMSGRPGYGLSSPRPGRVAADVAADIGEVLDHLGVDSFISMGCSGGGPHVLACAALLPTRCLAAACVVSPAPIDADGLDYYAGMGEENAEEWRLAEQGRDVVEPWLEKAAVDMRNGPISGFADQYGGAFPAVDLELMKTGFGTTMQASMQKAVSTGVEGWLEDDIVLVTPWGFDLGAITTPVAVWTGRQDRMVSWEHSVWIARAIPGADLHVIADQGHLSVQVAALGEIVQDLVDKSTGRNPTHLANGVST